MAIIKQYHQDTDTTYVYESISYWDEEKKQSRSKRKVIGKLDPETGEIIPTGKRGRKRKEGSPAKLPEGDTTQLQRLYDESQAKVKELTLELGHREALIKTLTAENDRLTAMVSRAREKLEECTSLLSNRGQSC